MSKLAYGGGIGSAECRGGREILVPAVDVLHRGRSGFLGGTERLFSSIMDSLAGPEFDMPVREDCWNPGASCLGLERGDELIFNHQCVRDSLD